MAKGRVEHMSFRLRQGRSISIFDALRLPGGFEVPRTTQFSIRYLLEISSSAHLLHEQRTRFLIPAISSTRPEESTSVPNAHEVECIYGWDISLFGIQSCCQLLGQQKAWGRLVANPLHPFRHLVVARTLTDGCEIVPPKSLLL